MDEAELRAVVEAAGPALWNPPHLADRPLATVHVDDVVPLPVGYLAVGRTDDDVVVTPIVQDADAVRRARPGDGVVASLVDVLVAGGAGSIDAVHVVPQLPRERTERSMGVDQANESYVIGDSVVVKLFPRSAIGARPAVDVPAHLAAVGFDETPPMCGVLRLHRDVVIASASAFVPGARDGWDWYVELVQRACDDGSWSEADDAAGRIGGLVARLHRAMATPSEIVPDPSTESDAGAIRRWQTRALGDLEEAVAGTPGDAGERLRRLGPRARAIIDRMLAIDRTPVQRIHGDLHVGQILRDDKGALWVSDFDGNPLASPAADPRDTPARDVAAMACAIDHVGRVVARREPDARAVLADWIERARAMFLSAYRLELGDGVALYDERLLHPLAVAQETHEYRYAAAFLPRWSYVPDAAMPAAIARAEADA